MLFHAPTTTHRDVIKQHQAYHPFDASYRKTDQAGIDEQKTVRTAKRMCGEVRGTGGDCKHSLYYIQN